jgi:hypothetical protein
MNVYYQTNLLGEEEFHVPSYFSLKESGNLIRFDFDSPHIKGFSAYDAPGEENNSVDKVELSESCLERFISLIDAGKINEAMFEAIDIFDSVRDEVTDDAEELLGEVLY